MTQQDYKQFFAQNGKLHPKVKKNFLKNLRSGKFKQCFGMTCQKPDPNKEDLLFCAYGVLLETFAQLNFPLTKLLYDLPYDLACKRKVRRVCISYQNQGCIPALFLKETGIENLVHTLVNFNDLQHLSFNQIADQLESLET